MRIIGAAAGAVWALSAAISSAHAEDADALSKKLANPVAHMISVPFQGNFDFGGGAHSNGFASTTNIQPVVPIPLGDQWSVIIRTILPVIERDRFGVADGAGVGDITQTFFLTPRAQGSFVWGVGPVFLWPTATDDRFGSGKWGGGPAALALLQTGPWTIGGMANHIW